MVKYSLDCGPEDFKYLGVAAKIFKLQPRLHLTMILRNIKLIFGSDFIYLALCIVDVWYCAVIGFL